MVGMDLLERFRQRESLWCQVCEWAIIVLVILSVVWRGGKSIDMTWLLTGVATMATLSYHLGRRPDQEVPVPLRIWVCIIGFILVTLASFVFSSTQNYGFDELLRTASLGLLFLWMYRRASFERENNDYDYVLRLLRVLALTTVGACLIGVLVYTFQPVSRFVGTFFDYRFHTDYWPNAWAQFLLLSWPAVLFLALKDFAFDKKSTKSRAAFLVRSLAVGLVVGCLFLSFSRGGVIAFGLQLLLWAATLYHKTRPEFPMRRAVPVAFMVMVIALSTFIAANAMRSQVYSVQDVGEKVTFSASEGTSSVTERLQFWQQAFSLSLQKPLLGWGPYSFRFVQPLLQEGVLATSDHPHNVFLKLAMERGYIALALFVALLFIVLWNTLAALLFDNSDEESLLFSVRTFMFIGVTGVLAHNMIDFNLQFVGIALPFWLLLAVLFTYINTEHMRSVNFTLSRTTEMVLAACVLLIALYEGGYLVVSSLGRHAEAVGNTEQALQWYEKADGEIFSRDLHLSRAKLYYQESDLPMARQAIESYMIANPEDYRAWKQLGDIALLQGEKAEAMTAFEHAFERGKYNDIGITRGMIEAYLASDMREDIERMLPHIDELMTKYAAAIQVNAHFIALSPNVEEFVFLANTLSRLFPDYAPKYQVMAAKADHQAQIERRKIESRPPGFLW